MVNEVNKPPPEASENAVLEERLANSNRQLAEMQEEHQLLVAEMEMLRQRAAALSLRNAQQSTRVSSASPTREIIPPIQEARQSVSLVQSVASAEQPKTTSVTVNDAAFTNTGEVVSREEEEGKEEDPETAEYIRMKLAEVAELKAQLRRVQNLVNTTNIIEEHMTKNTQSSSTSTTAASSTDVNSSTPATAPQTGTQDAREELLSNMLNMFTDFTSDLRGQADSLRAERDRIKLLKEEILRSRRGNQ